MKNVSYPAIIKSIDCPYNYICSPFPVFFPQLQLPSCSWFGQHWSKDCLTDGDTRCVIWTIRATSDQDNFSYIYSNTNASYQRDSTLWQEQSKYGKLTMVPYCEFSPRNSTGKREENTGQNGIQEMIKALTWAL